MNANERTLVFARKGKAWVDARLMYRHLGLNTSNEKRTIIKYWMIPFGDQDDWLQLDQTEDAVGDPVANFAMTPGVALEILKDKYPLRQQASQLRQVIVRDLGKLDPKEGNVGEAPGVVVHAPDPQPAVPASEPQKTPAKNHGRGEDNYGCAILVVIAVLGALVGFLAWLL